MQHLYHIGVSQNSPIQVFNDGQSTHALVFRKTLLFRFSMIIEVLVHWHIASSALHGRTEYIGVHYHFLRGLMQSQVINLVYCPSHENVADLFTKPLPRQTIDYLLDRLNVGPPFWT
jgi:hypothetical protein